jgi:hypothetical protein
MRRLGSGAKLVHDGARVGPAKIFFHNGGSGRRGVGQVKGEYYPALWSFPSVVGANNAGTIGGKLFGEVMKLIWTVWKDRYFEL